RVSRSVSARSEGLRDHDASDADGRYRRAGRPHGGMPRPRSVGAHPRRRSPRRRVDALRRARLLGGELRITMTDGFETRAIHAGQDPDPHTGAIVTPISLSTTFAQDGVGKHRGYEYARSDNPTRAAMEACIASLEGARYGMGFASGLAA